jgi:tripartite-type tricarboxylate transporter receptor subunit TctC
MILRRRQFLSLAAGTAAFPAVTRIARAQAYPSRPVTFIAPWPAGSTTDIALRPLVAATEKHLGSPLFTRTGRALAARSHRRKWL